MSRRKVIEIQPDGPALLAARLVRRLTRDGLIHGAPHTSMSRTHVDRVTEALADEIHQSTIDGTLAGPT